MDRRKDDRHTVAAVPQPLIAVPPAPARGVDLFHDDEIAFEFALAALVLRLAEFAS